MVMARARVAVALGCLTAGLCASCTAESVGSRATGATHGSPLATASPSPSAAQVPEAEPAWLPPPWTLQSTTRSAPISAAQPEYLFCDWRVPPSRVVNGDRTVVSEQVLVHAGGLRARLIQYETNTPGGVSNLFKLAYDSCLVPGKAESVEGPRNLWVYRGVAGGSDLGLTPGGVPVPHQYAQAMHVVEISSESARRPPTRDDVEAALDAWVSST